MRTVTYPELVARLTGLSEPAVAVISGFGGSGKSALARRVTDSIPVATVISSDDFMCDPVDARSDDWACIDRTRLVRDVLQPVRNGAALAYRPYDWASGHLGPVRLVPRVRLLVLEGVGLLHPEVIPFIDVSVWISCPAQRAHEQGRRRDRDVYGLDHDRHWREVWGPNDEDYFARFRPDLVANYHIEADTLSPE